MSRISQIARFLLVIHGLVNMAQGLHSITAPRKWAALAGSDFDGTPNKSVQAIGTSLFMQP